LRYETITTTVSARQFTLEAAEEMQEFEQWSNGSVKGTCLEPSERICECWCKRTNEEIEVNIGDFLVKYPTGLLEVFSEEVFLTKFKIKGE
jgi:hypothetical protein